MSQCIWSPEIVALGGRIAALTAEQAILLK